MTKCLCLLLLVLCLDASPVLAAPTAPVAAGKPESAGETTQRDKLQQARHLIADGKSADAIALIDQVLAYYATRYPDGETRWYVARSPEESLLYVVEATLPSSSAPGKRKASSLIVAWADAFFLKGYAWNELGRPADAKPALEQAVRLSPHNATYLIELAEAYKLERNWAQCYRLYRDAEGAAEFSPPEQKLADRLQAKRGQAFVFVEQGKFDQATAILEQCLKLDPHDARAKQELEYIAQRRKQTP